MDNHLYINSSVRIQSNVAYLNGRKLEIPSAENDTAFAKNAYKYCEISYPKFYKMDLMAKYGFLASELLLKGRNLPENTSLIFANKTASLHTDIQYHQSIKDKNNFAPSPSLFVYTLSNIVVGEICIRNKFKGENLFMVLDKFSSERYYESVSLQLELKKATHFIVSWIELLDEEINIFSALLSPEKQENSIPFNIHNLNTLNNTI